MITDIWHQDIQIPPTPPLEPTTMWLMILLALMDLYSYKWSLLIFSWCDQIFDRNKLNGAKSYLDSWFEGNSSCVWEGKMANTVSILPKDKAIALPIRLFLSLFSSNSRPKSLGWCYLPTASVYIVSTLHT